MDPITGIIGLTAIGAASLLGMKLKREGFSVLPGNATDQYPASVEESQTRYNKFSGMINPLVNAVIPVGSDQATIEEQRQKVNQALGNTEAVFSREKLQTLQLKEVMNKNIPRAEGDRSLFGAMQFCRAAAAKTDRPFSIRDPNTNKITKPSEKSANGIWDFDEVCGVCLTKGIDEEGKPFDTPRGMILDPNAKQTAYEERARKGYPYPRIAPALATCQGAPMMPVFAANDNDLVRYQRRLKCQHTTAVGGADNCAICYEHDTRSYVPLKDDPKNDIVAVREAVINLNLQGVGSASILLMNKEIARVTLQKGKVEVVPLTEAIEGQTFSINVRSTTTNTLPQLYGYIESSTPNGGTFRMPLNLIMTKDAANNNLPPNRAYGFYSYKELGFLCAILGPASGKTTMNLQGLVPFTFVQPDEFSAIDCPAAPFQASPDTIRDYAKDQPCFTKDSKPGQYNTACLQEVIINAGCTSQGTLYNKPESLNGTKAKPNDLFAIYNILQDLKDNDMVDEEKTMMCSGRRLARPCDPFLARTDLKFMPMLMGEAQNEKMKENAKQCLSQIYNNQGANETIRDGLGPTYSGLVTYKNNQRERKNIYCLPDGKLNPDNSNDALMALAKIADEGYANMYSVQAVKKYLNDQLELAADWRYNANKDSGRKTAIENCFGKSLAEIPQLAAQEPTMLEDVCGILAKFVRIRPKPGVTGVSIGVSQVAIVDKNGNNIAPGADTTLSSPPLNIESPASSAVDGILAVRSGTLPKYLSRDRLSEPQFVIDLGVPRDITQVIYYGVDMGNYLTTKGQLVLELLDESQKVLASKDCTTSRVDRFDFLSPEADETTCKTALIAKAVTAVTPSGYGDGLYGRYYAVTNTSPGSSFGSSGWGDRIGDVGPYTNIQLTGSPPPSSGKPYVFFVKGYYIVNDPQILYLRIESVTGSFVSLNKITVFNNWDSSQRNQVLVSDPIYLKFKGLYPIQFSFYNKITPGNTSSVNQNFKISYKINEETEWKSALGGAFVYNINEEQLLDEQWQQELRRREEARIAAEKAAALAARNAKIAEFQSQLASIKNTMMAYYKDSNDLYTEAEKFSQNFNITAIRSNLLKLRDIFTLATKVIEQINALYSSIMAYDNTLNTTFEPIVVDIKSYYDGPQGLTSIITKMNNLITTTQKLIDTIPTGYQNGLYVRTFVIKPDATLPVSITEDVIRAKKSGGGWSLQLTRTSGPKTKFGIGYKPNTYIQQASDNLFGNIARGYYFSKSVDHTLQFYVITHGAFYIKFDGRVIQSQAKWGGFGRGYWNFTVQVSGAKRLYPIEIVWESDWVEMGWWRSDSGKPSWDYRKDFTDFFIYNVEEEKGIDEEYQRNLEAINSKVQELIRSGKISEQTFDGVTRYFRVFRNQNLGRACLGYKNITQQITKEQAINEGMDQLFNRWRGYSDQGFNFSIEKRTPDRGGNTFISTCRFDTSQDYGFRSDINEYQDTYIQVSFDDLINN